MRDVSIMSESSPPSFFSDNWELLWSGGDAALSSFISFTILTFWSFYWDNWDYYWRLLFSSDDWGLASFLLSCDWRRDVWWLLDGAFTLLVFYCWDYWSSALLSFMDRMESLGEISFLCSYLEAELFYEAAWLWLWPSYIFSLSLYSSLFLVLSSFCSCYSTWVIKVLS